MKRFVLRFGVFMAIQAMFVALLCDPELPRERNYLARTIEKHDRLRTRKSPRLILVGGSNVAFGFVTEELGKQLGLEVVNMGLTAGLGIRFMIDEVRDQVRPGDVVLLSPEYGFPSGNRHLFRQILEMRPASVAHMPLSEWTKEVGDAGLSWIGGFFQKSLLRLRGDEESILDLDYRRDGFDYANSYIAHFGKPSKFTPEREVEPTAVSSMEPFVLEMLADFAAHCKRVGALCVFSFPPQPSDLRAFDPTDAQALTAQLLAIPDLTVIDRPEDQTQPLSRFYDTTYHLTREGAAQRTERVTTVVRRLMNERATESGSSSR